MVVRTGMPYSPKTSQNSVGKEWYSKFSMPSFARRFSRLSVVEPLLHIPDTSPFISARNTGTPISLNDSAITFKVTVLPVPVAPAMRPWRFAIFGKRYTYSVPLPIKILLSIYIFYHLFLTIKSLIILYPTTVPLQCLCFYVRDLHQELFPTNL